MSVAVIGCNGWVGKAMMSVFPDAYPYDVEVGRQSIVNDCDVAFICVPTPNLKDGSLDMSIVEDVVKWCACPLIVIRSTLQPGAADALAMTYHKQIVVQPEYLGETVAHPLLNEGKRPFLVIGGSPGNRRKLIELYQGVYNANITVRQVSLREAEIIKLSENRAIAFKVAQCQELYDVCELAKVDYYTVRDAVYGDDPRFNLWFSFVFPDNRGMNSKCIPKDVLAWSAWAETLGYLPEITNAILSKNEEWLNAVSNNS